MLELYLLGCGGMLPLPWRWLSALLVRYRGKMLLVDCGEGTQIVMKQTGWGCKNLEAICITHYHGDHVAGLPGLLMTIGNSGRTDPLTLCGPPGLSRVVNGLLVIAPELPFPLKLVELPENEPTTTPLGAFLLHSLPVDHNLPCLAYCIELKRAGRFDPAKATSQNIPKEFWNRLQRGEQINWQGTILTQENVLGQPRKGLRVCYCTDSRPTAALVDFARGSDLLVCEGMYGSDEYLPKALANKHMLFSEAARLAEHSMVRELWLTHYSPSLLDPGQYLETAQNIFPNTVLGEDLLKKTLHFVQD